MVDWY